MTINHIFAEEALDNNLYSILTITHIIIIVNYITIKYLVYILIIVILLSQCINMMLFIYLHYY